MKTYTKISSLAVVCALCAGASMPASAAPSVRALGGAGTYSSASSATQAKSGTTSSVEKADTVRGGSLAVGNTGATTTTAKKATTTSNVNSGLRGSSVRSASVRVPSTARLSIGKYLGGSTVSKPPVTDKQPTTPSVSEDFVEYDIQYNDKTYVLTINERREDGSYGEVMVRDIASHEDLMDLQELVGDDELDTSAKTIIAAINELVSGKQDKLTAGDGIAIDGDEISVNLIGENGITVDGNVIGFEGGDLQSKLTAGDGIAIDGDMISARVGNGLAIENGVIVTDIELPDAPIQKKIEAGDGIKVVEGTDSDTVAVNILPDGAGGLIVEDGVLKTKIDLPDMPVQEKLTAGDGISQTVLDTGKIGVNILPDGAGGLIVEDGVLKTKIDLPDTPVQEKLNAGTGIKIADNVISTNLESGSPSNLTIVTDPSTGKQTISVVGLANADGIIEYKQGSGIAISGDNQISANIGSGLKFNELTGAIETVATLPASGEVQEKLSAGKYINIDENNTITTTLTGSETINISNEGVISATVDLKEYDGTNSITVTDGEDGKTAAIAVKLANENSGLKVDEAGLAVNAGKGLIFDENGALTVTFDPDANTTYEAGQGISISADNNAINVNAGNGIAISENKEIAISADSEGLYLYSFAGGKGTWSMVDVVDENDVADPTPAAE